MDKPDILKVLLNKLNDYYGKPAFRLANNGPFDLVAPGLGIGVFSGLRDSSSTMTLAELIEHIRGVFYKLQQAKNDPVQKVLLIFPVEKDQLIEDFLEFGKNKYKLDYEFELWDWNKLKELWGSSEQMYLDVDEDKYFVNQVPSANIHQLFGIEEPLAKIDQLVDSSLSPVVIYNPLPGTGKTTLALSYLYHFDYQKKFDHVAFVELSGSFEYDFLRAFDNQSGFVYNKRLSAAENYRQLIGLLNRIEGRNLLVLDNVISPHQVAEAVKLSSLLKWKILVTSRVKIYSFENFHLHNPGRKHAIRIFEYYAKNETDRRSVAQLVEKLNYHPWATVFFAKAVDHFSPGLSASKLLELFESKSKKVYHLYEYIDRNLPKSLVLFQRNLMKYIMALYQYQVKFFSAGEKRILRILAMLPGIHIKYEQLQFFLEGKTTDKYTEDYLSLISKGWIDADKDLFVVHSFAKWVLHKKLKPDHQKITSYYNFVLHRLSENDYSYIPFAESVIERMADRNLNAVPMSVFLASLYENTGNSVMAKYYYQVSASVLEERLSVDFSVETLELLVVTLYEAEDYEKAVFYALQLAGIYRGMRDFVKLAEVYGTLAELYALSGDYEHAIYYVDNALDLLSDSEQDNAGLLDYLEKLHDVLSEQFSRFTKEQDNENWFRNLFI